MEEEGASIEADALALIIELKQGYPFFLQEWGHHAWNVANESPIGVEDVEAANERALARLDEGFFRVRFDRLTKAEVDYVKAMAQLGVGPYKVNDVAQVLGKQPKSLGPRRANIKKRGMTYAPSYGEIAFTVPLFEDFLQRTHL